MDNLKQEIIIRKKKITNPIALGFVNAFLMHREINRCYYLRVPEDKLDVHLVDNERVKSDSPRKNLIHQIDVTRDYINGILTGELKHKHKEYLDLLNPEEFNKEKLILKFDESTLLLLKTLSHQDINKIKVRVKWSKFSVPALQMIWGLNNHEILHTGWNLAYMDFLGIERFPQLKAMWG
ncbi:hypothetical protein AUK04_02770 [Candidatus Roizmanbacteria bacterium CG2_30_33_16]|uniref:DinB-like domain-containing protein n=3 Tax=Candidatus Roizmaniibacteriota TaxID=1752723 RepID=A0A2M8DE48_9BACT|nr:MAG: hypothetical protein AUK04_02770 [Candidatus Roizmanbacteria bacterium CG2_30_33_16]PJB89608.1 MAG: hypothetical protein CO083_00470 [Candidatus Roizmanbacteria bacterium CG_4_9_14_0_8_um_filter_34_12]